MTHNTINHDQAPEDSEPQDVHTQPSTPSKPPALTTIQLDDIVERDQYTRTLDPEHIKALADNIEVVGLEQPIVLITGNELVAGRHRVEALKLLRERNRAQFEEMFPGGIPAMRFDLGERPSRDAILKLELSENALRKNYSIEDRKRLVENLEAQGLQTKRGRPKPGELGMVKTLMKRLGASRATVNRLLASTRSTGSASADTIPKPKGRPKKAAARVEVDDEALKMAPTDAVEPILKLDPVQVACDAVQRLTRKELKRFNIWFKDNDHEDAVTVPPEDDDA